MKSFKFVQFADLHMDYPFENIQSPDTGVIRRADQKKTFDMILEKAAEFEADFIICAGDLYEHSCISENSIKYMADGFAKCRSRVVLLPGNHDPYLKNSVYMRTKWSENVTVLAEEMSDAFFSDKELMIHGIGFDRDSMTGEFQLPEIAENQYFNILVVHGELCEESGTYYNMSADELLATNADYIALGHGHQREMDIGGKGKIYRSGSPEALHVGETGIHGIILGEVNVDKNGEAKVSTKFVRTSQKEYIKLYIDSGSDYSEERIISCVRNSLRPGLWERSAENIIAQCTVAVESGISQEDVKRIDRVLKKIFFRCVIDYILVPADESCIIPLLEDAVKESGAFGRFAKKIAAQLETAQDDTAKNIVLRAYEIGTEALLK